MAESNSNITFNVPILFIVFNRFESTRLVFDQIKEIRPSKIYLASDGPRENKPSEALIIYEIREYLLQNCNWNCEIFTKFSDTNLGCKHAVSSSIDWFFTNEMSGIILEDDCLPDPSFFHYCAELLVKYEFDFSVSHIAGSNHLCDSLIMGDYFFSKYTLIWGWATWRSRWKDYDILLKNIKSNNFIDKMFSNWLDRYYWKSIFNQTVKGEIDTWDYQWMFTCWNNGKKAILPQKNMITNSGFSEDATHTVDNLNPLANLPRFSNRIISEPTTNRINFEIDELIQKRFFRPTLYSVLKFELRNIILIAFPFIYHFYKFIFKNR